MSLRPFAESSQNTHSSQPSDDRRNEGGCKPPSIGVPSPCGIKRVPCQKPKQSSPKHSKQYVDKRFMDTHTFLSGITLIGRADASAFRCTGFHHAPYHQVVKGPNYIEIQRPGPVKILNRGDDMIRCTIRS